MGGWVWPHNRSGGIGRKPLTTVRFQTPGLAARSLAALLALCLTHEFRSSTEATKLIGPGESFRFWRKADETRDRYNTYLLWNSTLERWCKKYLFSVLLLLIYLFFLILLFSAKWSIWNEIKAGSDSTSLRMSYSQKCWQPLSKFSTNDVQSKLCQKNLIYVCIGPINKTQPPEAKRNIFP